MAAHRAKIQSIAEAAESGWNSNGRTRRPRRVSAPPRVAPEVLLRSPLFLVPRRAGLVRHQAAAAHGPFARMQGRSLPLTIGPETRLANSLWRRQDKYYAAILLGLAVLVWCNPF